MDNVKNLAVKGAFWNGLQLIVNASFTFIIRLVLAKLLLPDQFGLVGMATVFTGLIQVINDLGIGAALIQKKDDDLNETHFHTAFWTGVIWSAFLYVIISFAVGPLAASFYGEPLLNKLIPVLSIGILFSPVNMVHKAQLTKQMNFKKMAFIDNVSNIVAGSVALGLAFLGAGVWSLVFNSVASYAIAMPLYFMATGWLPKFIWNSESFKDVFGFGVYTTGTNIVNYAINSVDYLFIGKLLSTEALGAYTFAFILTDTFKSRLMAVINNVMYPLYGKKQSDPESLKRYYLKVVNYNSIIVYPIMVLLFGLGEPLILNFFGDKWVMAIAPLRILSLSVMVAMMVNSNTSLIRGMGKPELELKLQFVKALIFIPTLIVGIYYYGIIGAAWAVLINKVIAVLIAQYTFNRLLHISVGTMEFLNAVKEPWIASAISYLALYFLYQVAGVHYIISGILFMIVYCGVIYVMLYGELKSQLQQLKLSSKQ